MASKGSYPIFIFVTMCFFSLAATVKPGREVSKGYVLIVGTCNEDVDCRGSCNNNDVLLAVATCLKIPFGVGKECCCLTIDEKLGREDSKRNVWEIVGTCNSPVDCRRSCKVKGFHSAIATCLNNPAGGEQQCYCLIIVQKNV